MKLVVYLSRLSAPASRDLMQVYVDRRAKPFVYFTRCEGLVTTPIQYHYWGTTGLLQLTRSLPENGLMTVKQDGKWLRFSNLGGVMESLG